MLTSSQARMLYLLHQAREAERLRAMCQIIMAGAAPTASKEGASIYNEVRGDLQEAADRSRSLI